VSILTKLAADCFIVGKVERLLHGHCICCCSCCYSCYYYNQYNCVLLSGEHDTSHPMLSVDEIPPSFIEQHRECCRRFMNWQTATIVSNIATFQMPADAATVAHRRRLRQYHAVAYISRFCWRAIDDSQRVVPAADNWQDLSVRMWHIFIYCWLIQNFSQYVKYKLS